MIELVAELATAHGGDVALAEDMIRAAANSGAHSVKLQSYTLAHLNPGDPQYAWLRRSRLTEKDHDRLMKVAQAVGVDLFSTAFDRESLQMLLKRHWRIKVASSQPIWHVNDQSVVMIKSWPWGKRAFECVGTELTAIPLYPTPIEAVAAAPLLDGWSDHTIGTHVCKHMISRGARMIEAHFCLPGRSRQMPWDKTPKQFRKIRDWAELVETVTKGVSQQFRERWSA